MLVSSDLMTWLFTNYLSILVTNDGVPPNKSLVHVVQEPIPLAGILHWPEFYHSFYYAVGEHSQKPYEEMPPFHPERLHQSRHQHPGKQRHCAHHWRHNWTAGVKTSPERSFMGYTTSPSRRRRWSQARCLTQKSSPQARPHSGCRSAWHEDRVH